MTHPTSTVTHTKLVIGDHALSVAVRTLMCKHQQTYLVHTEEDALGGEVKQGTDELRRHIHLHDQLLATLTTKDGMAQQSL